MPKGVKEIEVFVVGGGNPDPIAASCTYFAGGGGAGYTKTAKISVNPGNLISAIVGAGGGQSSIEDVIALPGKLPYTAGRTRRGSSGGSAGGAGPQFAGDIYNNGASDGGSSRSYGWWGDELYYSGTGQGTTTRAFEDPNGTLYAGGGAASPGSGRSYSYYGGAGGGGNAYGDGKREAGHTNTGGGGAATKIGGSGIAIIRWGY